MRPTAVREGHRLRVQVPAKINLFLAVRGSRRDGYHELLSVMQTIAVFDRLDLSLAGPLGLCFHPAARQRMRFAFEVLGAPGLPLDRGNLAVRAAELLGRRVGIGHLVDELPKAGATALPPQVGPARSEAHTTVCLRKGIPVAGGMAGGSADAAAALVALNQLWGCGLGREELRDIAASLGSDVPFCLTGGTALATGSGTTTVQVLCRGTFYWVVAGAREPLETAKVYRSWDRCCAATEVPPDAVLAALRGSDAAALGAALHNELEPAAFALRPGLRGDKELLLKAGALGAVLSGSGPTLLGLAEDEAAAQGIAAAVAEEFEWVAVARSPAGGPELLVN